MIKLEQAKRDAKAIKAAHGIKHCTALEIVAIREGFPNWLALLAAIEETDSSEFARRAAEKWEINTLKQRNHRRCQQIEGIQQRKDATDAIAAVSRGWSNRAAVDRLDPGMRPVNQLAANVVYRPLAIDEEDR